MAGKYAGVPSAGTSEARSLSVGSTIRLTSGGPAVVATEERSSKEDSAEPSVVEPENIPDSAAIARRDSCIPDTAPVGRASRRDCNTVP